MNLRFESHSESETIRLGEAFARVLRPGDVVAFHGELGAGKTRLIRGVARGFGVPDDAVSSPTYVIAQEYPGKDARSPRLVHVDAYRLRGEDELESAGWDRLVQADDVSGIAPILLVEWAERIPAALRGWTNRADVSLSHAAFDEADERGSADAAEDQEGVGRREITMTVPDAWSGREGFAGLRTLSSEQAAGGTKGQVMSQKDGSQNATSAGSFSRDTARASRAAKGIAPGDGDAERPATRCRVTGKVVPGDSPTYPFFDEKARLADLNRWFTGGYTISRDITSEDVDETERGGPG